MFRDRMDIDILRKHAAEKTAIRAVANRVSGLGFQCGFSPNAIERFNLASGGAGERER